MKKARIYDRLFKPKKQELSGHFSESQDVQQSMLPPEFSVVANTIEEQTQNDQEKSEAEAQLDPKTFSELAPGQGEEEEQEKEEQTAEKQAPNTPEIVENQGNPNEGAPTPPADVPNTGNEPGPPANTPPPAVPNEVPATAPAQVEPPIQAAPVPAPTTSSGVQAPGFAPLLGQVSEKRAAVADLAETKKAQVRASLSTEKRGLAGKFENWLAQINSAFAAAKAKVSSQSAATRIAIQSGQTEKLAQLDQARETRLAELEEAISEQHDAMLASGEAMAAEAEKFGETEGQRAITGAAERKARAENMAVERKEACEIQGYERVPRIGKVVGDLAVEAGDEFVSTSEDAAEQVRSDANDLAQKFREESQEAASEFGKAREEGQKRIQDFANAGKDAVQEIATEALRIVDLRETAALEQLGQEHSQNVSQFAGMRDSALQAFNQQGDAMCQQFDQQANSCVEEVDAFQAQIQQFAQEEGDSADESMISDLQTAFFSAYESVVTGLTGMADSNQSKLKEAGSGIAAQATGRFQAACSSADTFAKGYETDILGLQEEAVNGMAEQFETADTEMDTVVTDIYEELEKAIQESETQWEKDLEAGKGEISAKVDGVLAEQDVVLTELRTKMAEEAESIEHESALWRGLKMVGGFLWGVLKGLGKMILIILAVALAILALVVLIAWLLPGLFAFLASLAVSLAASAVFMAIVKGVFLAMAAYSIFQARQMVKEGWENEELGDFERGAMVGEGTFDIISELNPVKKVRQLARFFKKADAPSIPKRPKVDTEVKDKPTKEPETTTKKDPDPVHKPQNDLDKKSDIDKPHKPKRKIPQRVLDLPKQLRRRVKLRKKVKEEILSKARTGKGEDNMMRWLDGEGDPIPGNKVTIHPVTGKKVYGDIHFGHKDGQSWKRYQDEIGNHGKTRKEVIADQNNPDIYVIQYGPKNSADGAAGRGY